jgi:hypothetical protein
MFTFNLGINALKIEAAYPYETLISTHSPHGIRTQKGSSDNLTDPRTLNTNYVHVLIVLTVVVEAMNVRFQIASLLYPVNQKLKASSELIATIM